MHAGARAVRLAAAAALFTFTLHLHAQGRPAPRTSGARSTSGASVVKQGAILFRQECVFCHGVGGRGGMRGPDLTTGAWTHGGSDAALTRTILSGVPGTAMPPNHLTKEEVRQIIGYLRSVQQPPSPAIGNAAAGERLFFGTATCSACHMVNGRGGRLGPDLSRVGSARPRTYLIESIREPDRQLADNANFGTFSTGALRYDTVVAVTRAGETVRGVALNEDTFTVQVMDKSEKIFSLDKHSLKSFTHEPTSLMPAYSEDMLSERDLLDVVAYLQSLRTSPQAPRKGGSSDQN